LKYYIRFTIGFILLALVNGIIICGSFLYLLLYFEEPFLPTLIFIGILIPDVIILALVITFLYLWRSGEGKKMYREIKIDKERSGLSWKEFFQDEWNKEGDPSRE
jgi:uncharacterized membrane protein YbhN (UPF0104 family)